MHDFGYDVSDYNAIEPIFGSMQDFDNLLEALHKRKIRLLLDLVANHTSHEHPWFVESRSSRTNPKRDWYVWRDGNRFWPPNNWQSVFGGSAWEWDSKTESYYLHSFLKEQPDLNWRNDEVKAAIFEVMEFWLKKGVDGFRLDVVNMFFKDSEFKSNPLRLWGWRYPRPYEFQTHIHDMSQDEMHPMLKDMRQLLDKYNAVAVGEVMADFAGDTALAASYLGDNDELHLTFDFTLLYQKWDAHAIGKTLAAWYTACSTNWPTLVFNNHDQDRSVNRYSKAFENDARAKILAALLLTAKGTPFLYYGEEIAMKNGSIEKADLRDPVGIRFWPLTVSRDPARTPMLWDKSHNAGFSTEKPWLPVNDDYLKRNKEAQEADAGSVLNFYRKLLAFRKENAALRLGSFSLLDRGKNVLAFRREHKGDIIDVYLNFAAAPSAIPLPSGRVLFSNQNRYGLSRSLGGYEVLLIAVDS